MKNKISNDFDGFIALSNDLNWFDGLDLNDSINKKLGKTSAHRSSEMRKIMYEEWCMAKLRAKHTE